MEKKSDEVRIDSGDEAGSWTVGVMPEQVVVVPKYFANSRCDSVFKVCGRQPDD